LFVTLVIVSNTLGNTALSVGMKEASGPLLAALLNPWVAAGILLLIFWTVTRMTLLSWADLSYVLPVTSIGYVLNAMIGRFFLNEMVSWERWLGTLLIVAGASLVQETRRS
jgi:uncharacterized membrane protein